MSLNLCKSRSFSTSNLQAKRFDVLMNYLLLYLGALICLSALSIESAAGKRRNLWKLSKELGVSSSQLAEAIQTLVTKQDVWFDAFRYAYLCI